MKENTYKALTVRTASGEHKVFLQGGFYLSSFSTSCIHEHNYAEIHLIAGGNAEFTVKDQTLTLKSGAMLVIPSKVYHSCVSKDTDTMHCAFQIDCAPSSYFTYELNPELILEFFRTIKNTSEEDDHSAIAAYISLFCSCFEQGRETSPHAITDYGFIIYEFFSNNYSLPVRLSDLAQVLHLSERQAERLVLEHTGKSFRDELSATRVRIARYLLKTTNMPLGEIAEYTGYRSYAGFWKAMKKF